MGVMASECASLAVFAGSSSGYRHLAGGAHWVNAPTTSDAGWFCVLDGKVDGIRE